MANTICEAVKAGGAVSAAEPLMVHLIPEDADIAKCKEWAASERIPANSF